MKKLLSLLSVLTISGTAIPTTIAASPCPYQKEETKKIENSEINYLQISNLENLKRSKRTFCHFFKGQIYNLEQNLQTKQNEINNLQQNLQTKQNEINNFIKNKTKLEQDLTIKQNEIEQLKKAKDELEKIKKYKDIYNLILELIKKKDNEVKNIKN